MPERSPQAMLTFITTWVTERIVTVLTIVLVSFSTLPTTLILVSNHESDEAIHIQLIQQVRAEGAAVLVALTAAEQDCDGQLAKLATIKTNKPATVVQPLIASGKEREHAAVLKVVTNIRAEEARVVALKDLDDDEVQGAIERIHLVGTTALAPNGVVIVTCQTILVEIRTIIEVVIVLPPVIVPPRHEDDD